MDPTETQASSTAVDEMAASSASTVDVVADATGSDDYQLHEAMDTADSATTGTTVTNTELDASAATSPSAISFDAAADSANSPIDENSCSGDGELGGGNDGDIDDDGMQLHYEYESVRELVNEFRQMMADPANMEIATEYLYSSLLDEMVLGVAFEVHYAFRTGIMQALEGQPEDPKPFTLVRGPDVDVFGASCTKIQMDCTCPKCDRAVAASRFATHLEKCMGECWSFCAVFLVLHSKRFGLNSVESDTGMGRISSRIASRRLASTRDGGNSYFNGVQSDDEDDADWAGEKRKKKIQPVRTNGSKKNGKSSS